MAIAPVLSTDPDLALSVVGGSIQPCKRCVKAIIDTLSKEVD